MTKAITMLMPKDERQYLFLTMLLNHDDDEEKYDEDHCKRLDPEDAHLQEACPSG